MTRKTYNDEFKIAAAKLVRQQGYSVRKAAKSQVGDHGMENYVRKIDNLASA